jgi:hypothetical protein
MTGYYRITTGNTVTTVDIGLNHFGAGLSVRNVDSFTLVVSHNDQG